MREREGGRAWPTRPIGLLDLVGQQLAGHRHAGAHRGPSRRGEKRTMAQVRG